MFECNKNQMVEEEGKYDELGEEYKEEEHDTRPAKEPEKELSLRTNQLGTRQRHQVENKMKRSTPVHHKANHK